MYMYSQSNNTAPLWVWPFLCTLDTGPCLPTEGTLVCKDGGDLFKIPGLVEEALKTLVSGKNCVCVCVSVCVGGGLGYFF